MAPLIVLFVVTGVARLIGALGSHYVATWTSSASVGLAAMFTMTGIAHFAPRRRAGLIAIVPPALSRSGALVTLTGIVELLGAAALLVPREVGPLRILAAWVLAALMVIMFPANIYASRAKRHESAPHTPLLLRTVMQGMFIAVAVLVAVVP